MDCFAVSITGGALKCLNRKRAFKMAFFFGLFQGLMPLAGWLLGFSFKNQVASVDHWIAFTILSAIGLKMIVEAFGRKENKKPLNFGKWSVLLSLSVATSIDALIVGMGFGVLQVPILRASVLIGLTTFLVSFIGTGLGHYNKLISARTAALLGGFFLIGIGVKVLLSHLMVS